MMTSVSSEKIFIDPKEEITFIVERLLDAEKDRVVLVVPQNSLLLSSIVSIEILFRKLVKSKKLAIIVTEDEYGQAIASKVGFVVVQKVSHISSDSWEAAMNSKKNLADMLETRKKELLSNISDVKVEETAPEKENFTIEIQEEHKDDGTVELTEVSPEVKSLSEIEETEITHTGEPIDNEPSPEIKAAEEVKIAEVTNDESNNLVKLGRPRNPSKLIDLGNGIKILAGGDIKNYLDEQNSELEPNTDMSDPEQITRKVKTKNLGSFTGRDFTKAVSGESKFKAFISKFFKPKRISDPNERFEGISQTHKKNRMRVIAIVLVALLVLFSAGGYVLAFRTSTVDITLKLKKQDVSTSANLVVDTAATQMTLDPITIPGKTYEITPDKISISKTGTADGTAQRGNKAKGVVRIINSLPEAITLAVGTKFTSLSTSLVYVNTAEVVLDAATTGSGGVINAYIKEDVPIEASNLGTEYNISDSVTGTKFSIEGYDTTKLYASQYLPFTGGTSESFTSVSQDNFNKLKDSIMPDLKNQALEKLKKSVEAGYKLIEGSVEYDTTKEPEALPKVGEEAKDKTFNLTVQVGVKGLAVKSEDLVGAVTYLLKNTKSNDPNAKFEVANIADPTIDKVEKTDGGKFILTISSQGSVQTQVTYDQIKNDLAGLSISQANDYLHFIDYIEEYKISFNPDFVPDGFRRIPSEANRIRIKTV